MVGLLVVFFLTSWVLESNADRLVALSRQIFRFLDSWNITEPCLWLDLTRQLAFQGGLFWMSLMVGG